MLAFGITSVKGGLSIWTIGYKVFPWIFLVADITLPPPWAAEVADPAANVILYPVGSICVIVWVVLSWTAVTPPTAIAPVIATLSPTNKLWFLWKTLIEVGAEVFVRIGLGPNNARGKSAVLSCSWEASQVVLFCDLKKDPKNGCFVILLAVEPNSKSPMNDVHNK